MTATTDTGPNPDVLHWKVHCIWGHVRSLSSRDAVDDDEVVSAYTEGQCVAMARALCRILGWTQVQVVCLDENEDGDGDDDETSPLQLAHCWALSPDQTTCVDIEGARPTWEAIDAVCVGWDEDRRRLGRGPTTHPEVLDADTDFEALFPDLTPQVQEAADHFARRVVDDLLGWDPTT